MEANNLKILAIDDNKDNLERLKAEVLDALPGCTLLTALNEAQGVELARTEDPDVILLEGVMTGLDGHAVCRTLKRDERLRDIPVVFLTAPMTDRDSCIKALEAGAEAFLSQPLDRQELVAQVSAMTRLKATNRLRRLEKEHLAALVAERTRELEQESAERIQAEETLRASEELFRKLFEDHAAAKLLIDPDTGQIIDSNQAAAQFYGWSRNQLKQMKIQDINTLPPERVREEMDRARTGKRTHFEFRHRRADGSIRDVDVFSSYIEAKGKALLHSIIIDITERKQAEETLAQQNGALYKLNRIAGEFLRLSLEDNLEAFIAKQIKEISGARVALFSTYNPEKRILSIQHVEMEPELREKVVRLLGNQVNSISFAISGKIYQEMTTEIIGTWKTLYEASFGAVPHPVGAAIEALLKVDRFIGVAYLLEGELYGTSLLAMGKGQPDPPRNILENFIALAAVSLRHKRAEDALQLLLARNEALLGSIPDIVVEVDTNKMLKWANPAGIEFYGEDLVGREAAHYFVGEQDTYDRVQPLFAGDETTIHLESWQFRRDGEKRLLSWWCRVLKDSKGNVTGALSMARDITERYEAEAALRSSEQKFRTFIESAPVAISLTRAGKMMFVNDAYLRLFGIPSLQSVIGRPLTDLVAPQCRQEVAERAMRRARGERAEAEFESMAMRLDGLQFPCRVAVEMLELSDGPAILAFNYDLTTQKEVEKKLEDSRGKMRNLAVHLLHAREEERRKVAQEIHDNLGQVLTAIKMDLQWIEKRAKPYSAQVLDKIHGVVDLADQTIQIVHRIASALRPGVLDDLGLAAAIEWLCGDFSRRNGIPIRADFTAPESRIGGNSSTTLFRIVQEALANVALHSRATQASVEFFESNNALVLRIRDNGRGVTEDQVASPLSLGFIGIRERVESMGGALSITGKKGEGTLLEVSILLPSLGALA